MTGVGIYRIAGGATTVKGKADPVQVHKVLSQRDKPISIHRLSGLRADLVGRNVEMAELSETVDSLRQGKGRVFFDLRRRRYGQKQTG